MTATYGPRPIGTPTGHCFSIIATGEPIAHPVGITVDWTAVVAPANDVQLADGTIIRAGTKYLRYGQIMVKVADKWVPWSGQAMKRSETALITKTVIETGFGREFVSGATDHPEVIDGGVVFKDRLMVDVSASDAVGRQVETVTVVGTISTAGNAKAVITGAGIAGSPLTIPFAVLLSDTAAIVAGKARTAVGLNATITALFVVNGSGAQFILTANADRANDATLSVVITNDTCAGLTPATSVDTTPGQGAASGPPIASLIAAMPMVRYA